MWIYQQNSGKLSRDDGTLAGIGYSGAGEGKNNPFKQDVPNVGPIPRGLYLVGIPYDTPEHGPFVLPLTPVLQNQMFGRSGFLIHGDSIQKPGSASEGCIVLPRPVRDAIAASTDRRLVVIA